MPKFKRWKSSLITSASVIAVGLAATAQAVTLNIPGGDLGAALDAYTAQTGVSVIVSYDVVKGIQTQGVHGDISADDALVHILTGTGFVPRRQNGAVMIVPKKSSSSDVAPMQLAQAAPSRGAVETVTVTSSKLGGADVQSIPIADHCAPARSNWSCHANSWRPGSGEAGAKPDLL